MLSSPNARARAAKTLRRLGRRETDLLLDSISRRMRGCWRRTRPRLTSSAAESASTPRGGSTSTRSRGGRRTRTTPELRTFLGAYPWGA